jgi:hypothetical protein
LAKVPAIYLYPAGIGSGYRVSGQTNRSNGADAEGTLVFVDLGDRNGSRVVLFVVVDFGKPRLDCEILEEGVSCYPKSLRKESPVPERVAREVPSMLDGVRFAGKVGS